MVYKKNKFCSLKYNTYICSVKQEINQDYLLSKGFAIRKIGNKDFYEGKGKNGGIIKIYRYTTPSDNEFFWEVDGRLLPDLGKDMVNNFEMVLNNY